MNPYTFNVELYHQKSLNKPDPRDLLVPESEVTKRGNLFSAIKVLGKLTSGKARFVFVGGLLAVGCTVRFLRNRRQRLREERASKSRDETSRGSRTDACTQTDPFLDPVTVEGIPQLGREEKRTGVVDMDGALTPNTPTKAIPENGSITEACPAMGIDRNLSSVTGRSDSYTTPQCNCREEKAAGSATEADTQPHIFCNLSAFLALLALHKACMSEKEASSSTGQDKNILCETPCESQTPNGLLFNPGTRPSNTIVRNYEASFRTDTSSGERVKRPSSLRPTEVTSLRSEDKFTSASGLKNDIGNSAQSASQPRPNPFDKERLTIASGARGREKQGDPPLKVDFPVRSEIPLTHEQGAGKGSPVSFTNPSSSSSSSQDVRNHIRPLQKPAASGTAAGHSKEHKGSAGFRSQARSDSRSVPRRGKPRRRGTGRNNPPRRPYVDLDNPKSIAS